MLSEECSSFFGILIVLSSNKSFLYPPEIGILDGAVEFVPVPHSGHVIPVWKRERNGRRWKKRKIHLSICRRFCAAPLYGWLLNIPALINPDFTRKTTKLPTPIPSFWREQSRFNVLSGGLVKLLDYLCFSWTVLGRNLHTHTNTHAYILTCRFCYHVTRQIWT